MNITLNNDKYRYEIFQIFNIYFHKEDIIFTDTGEFEICILENKVIINNKENYVYKFEDDLKIKENIKKALYLYLRDHYHLQAPYGTLVGIRPSKIASKLIEEGYDEDCIIDYYYKHYLTSAEKAKLCIETANNEKKVINNDYDKISIYIDMPFCPTRCAYCSFASNPIKQYSQFVQPYLRALTYEIEYFGKLIKEKDINIDCVYFGGGTPTSIDEESFEKLMGVIYENFVYEKSLREFTVECGRVDSISFPKLNTMKKYNVDRISINPQTMNDRTLKMIGRTHTKDDVINTFNMARKLSFKNINMDIIIGLEEEETTEIIYTMDEIRKLHPDSITIHGLSIKKGSRLKDNGIKKHRSSEEIRKMYKAAHLRSREMGMIPYYMYRQKHTIGNMENTGYCLPSKEGIYNVEMIEDRESILALGADSVSKLIDNKTDRIERLSNVKDVKEYINRIDEMISRKVQLFFKEE